MLNPAVHLELSGTIWNGLDSFGMVFDTIFDTAPKIFDTV
jgi:hypothetical protein